MDGKKHILILIFENCPALATGVAKNDVRQIFDYSLFFVVVCSISDMKKLLAMYG